MSEAETVERIARALCRQSWAGDPDALVIPSAVLAIGPKGFPLPGPDPVPAWRLFILDAIAAWDAMAAPPASRPVDPE